jgi:hypothetical protein
VRRCSLHLDGVFTSDARLHQTGVGVVGGHPTSLGRHTFGVSCPNRE